jgi:hypothetical protein
MVVHRRTLEPQRWKTTVFHHIGQKAGETYRRRCWPKPCGRSEASLPRHPGLVQRNGTHNSDNEFTSRNTLNKRAHCPHQDDTVKHAPANATYAEESAHKQQDTASRTEQLVGGGQDGGGVELRGRGGLLPGQRAGHHRACVTDIGRRKTGLTWHTARIIRNTAHQWEVQQHLGSHCSGMASR